MKQKHYSFLDHRRTDFDVDYDEFCKSTAELHVSENKLYLMWGNSLKIYPENDHVSAVFGKMAENGPFFTQFFVFLSRTS